MLEEDNGFKLKLYLLLIKKLKRKIVDKVLVNNQKGADLSTVSW